MAKRQIDVEALRHAEAKRRNIPTGEPLLSKGDDFPRTDPRLAD